MNYCQNILGKTPLWPSSMEHTNHIQESPWKPVFMSGALHDALLWVMMWLAINKWWYKAAETRWSVQFTGSNGPWYCNKRVAIIIIFFKMLGAMKSFRNSTLNNLKGEEMVSRPDHGEMVHWYYEESSHALLDNKSILFSNHYFKSSLNHYMSLTIF